MTQRGLGNVIVSGGSGFLGKNLVRFLAEEGYSVRTIGRQISTLNSNSASEVVSEIKAFKPKYIIHLAAHATTQHDVAEIIKVLDASVVLGSILLEAAHTTNAAFLTTGSYWQHGPDESSSKVFYASAKDAFQVLSNFYREELGLSVRDITLFDTYGPGDNRSKILPNLLKAAITGNKVVLRQPDALINLTYVSDVVSAIMMALTSSNGPRKAVVRSESFIRLDDLVHVIEKISGRRINHVYSGEQNIHKITSPMLSGNLVSGWTPKIDLESGISNCLKSIRY